VLPAGSYTCYVRATDSSVPTQEAHSSTNRITILPTLRVMPLGDSITYGGGAAGGYRAPLYQLLTNAGYTVDFIGTQTGNGAASLPDPDHEGYSGATIRYIDSRLPNIFGAVLQPDIILLLLGVNDYRVQRRISPSDESPRGFGRAPVHNWPNTKIIVASLTEVSEPLNTQIQTTFNTSCLASASGSADWGGRFTSRTCTAPCRSPTCPTNCIPISSATGRWLRTGSRAVNLLPARIVPPRFVLQPSEPVHAAGTNVSLVVETHRRRRSRPISVRLEGTNIPNATNATYGFTNASILHQGNYTVAATDSNGTRSVQTRSSSCSCAGLCPEPRSPNRPARRHRDVHRHRPRAPATHLVSAEAARERPAVATKQHGCLGPHQRPADATISRSRRPIMPGGRRAV
jgi:hypothetical protein